LDTILSSKVGKRWLVRDKRLVQQADGESSRQRGRFGQRLRQLDTLAGGNAAFRFPIDRPDEQPSGRLGRQTGHVDGGAKAGSAAFQPDGRDAGALSVSGRDVELHDALRGVGADDAGRDERFGHQAISLRRFWRAGG